MNTNKSNTDRDCLVALLVFLAVPVVVVYSYLANGFVLSKLWSWFIVTTFGLQPLSIVQAIGVAMVIGFLTRQSITSSNKDKKTSEKIIEFVVALVSPFITLLVGWIIYSTWFVK